MTASRSTKRAAVGRRDPSGMAQAGGTDACWKSWTVPSSSQWWVQGRMEPCRSRCQPAWETQAACGGLPEPSPGTGESPALPCLPPLPPSFSRGFGMGKSSPGLAAGYQPRQASLSLCTLPRADWLICTQRTLTHPRTRTWVRVCSEVHAPPLLKPFHMPLPACTQTCT